MDHSDIADRDLDFVALSVLERALSASAGFNCLSRTYTTRSLSHEKDRLSALSSFSRQVGMPKVDAYCAGMWKTQQNFQPVWQGELNDPDQRARVSSTDRLPMTLQLGHGQAYKTVYSTECLLKMV